MLPNLFKSIDPDASIEEWKEESNVELDSDSEDEISEKSEKDSQQINNSWLSNIVNSLSMITSGKFSAYFRSIYLMSCDRLNKIFLLSLLFISLW